MKHWSFSLHPFAAVEFLSSFQISGYAARHSDTLVFRCGILGPLAELVIPEPADIPTRRNGLWEETCFELFLAASHFAPYWEFNISPSGHWNVYRFAAYRQGMQEEPAFSSLPFAFQNHSDSLRVDMEVDLDGILQADQALEVAVTAVVKHRNGQLTYWALTHRGGLADFHRRDSFIVSL